MFWAFVVLAQSSLTDQLQPSARVALPEMTIERYRVVAIAATDG